MYVYGKVINWFDHMCTLVCDGQCDLAFGINNRPKIFLSENNPDDYIFLSDEELKNKNLSAPLNPGTYEGGECKPIMPNAKFNKWCARECERSKIFEGVPSDMNKPEPNIKK